MNREEQLLAALKWALKEGAYAWRKYGGELSIQSQGCGCCSRDISPPDEISSIVEEAVQDETIQST